ncbi:protein UXT-like isoform X1 [Centruroides sculpturatus]|uniref:protein UXT-like isoform X1 n=1 Tax=Centruroides sculpturatus TaxID=218467 RepID=UPI000C6E81B8|nr:protein UXT-like isoform X1 [Centruroides sculpturatus]
MDYKNKVIVYENFINDVLKEDLKKILKERDRVCGRLAEYLQLQTVIERLQEEEVSETLKTKIDIGCNFYVQAVVPDCKKIFLHIGFGFYLEYTLDEAIRFINKKVKQLNKELEELSKNSAKVKAHIKLVLEGLRELQNLEAQTEKPRREIF